MEIREARSHDAVEISALLAQLGYEVPPDPVAGRIEARPAGHVVLVAAGPPGRARACPRQRSRDLCAEGAGPGNASPADRGPVGGHCPDRLAGVVELQRRAGLVEQPWAEVTALVVDENARRRGVGRALMRAAEDRARALGLPAVRLRSNVVRGAAHVFYLRLGYSLVKTQHCFLRRL